MSEQDWVPTSRMLPREGETVRAMDSGGHVQTLVYDKGLWWFPDRSMYVYYVPQMWQPMEAAYLFPPASLS